MVRDGQSMSWAKSMKSLTSGLADIVAAGQPSWGPRDPPERWLDTLSCMTQCGGHWRSYIRNPFFFNSSYVYLVHAHRNGCLGSRLPGVNT